MSMPRQAQLVLPPGSRSLCCQPRYVEAMSETQLLDAVVALTGRWQL
jgi:hypothetical protein